MSLSTVNESSEVTAQLLSAYTFEALLCCNKNFASEIVSCQKVASSKRSDLPIYMQHSIGKS